MAPGNLWELISSSSDVIPLRRTFNNGSLHFPHWSSGTGVSGSFASSSTSQLSVESRLQKLDHHFNTLKVFDDDCRQRLLCEIAESPTKFSPLTSSFLDETRLARKLILLQNFLLLFCFSSILIHYISGCKTKLSEWPSETLNHAYLYHLILFVVDSLPKSSLHSATELTSFLFEIRW